MTEAKEGLEDSFEKVFGQSVEEAIREERGVGEEGPRPKVRTTEAVPSEREAEEHNVDHGVFRSWCPHCVKGRAESYGHKNKKSTEKEWPTIGIDYMYMHSEQEKEEEVGRPIVVMKDSKTRMIAGRVVPSKGVESYAIGEVKKTIEKLGHKKVVMKSDNEPAILA